MRVVLLLLAAVTAGGCANDVCANIQGTCVALRVEGSGGVSSIQIDTSGAIFQTATVSGNNTTLPLLMPLQFHSGVSGAVVLSVQGRLGSGFVGQGVTTAQVIDGQHTTAAVILGGGNDSKVDAGGNGGFGGGGGGGGPGFLDMGGSCGGMTCPAGFVCDGTGVNCVPVNKNPPGKNCKQDGTIQCQDPSVCAPDDICRFPCGAAPDCMMEPMSECLSTFMSTSQKYCTISCPPVGATSSCPNSENCVVADYANSGTDCVVPNGKNYKNMPCGTSTDCAQGYSCYKKAGMINGICYGNCFGNNSACQTPAGGTCQVPAIAAAHWGVCCPSGSGNCL